MPGLKNHIIGLCGLASVGKDTVGDLLVTHAGFRSTAFANALRMEVADAFHVEPIVFTRRELKEQPMSELALSRCTDKGYVGAALAHLAVIEPNMPANVQLTKPRTPRQTMQLWGTEYRRAENPHYWARQVRDHIFYLMRQQLERNFVITDVRFANEVDTIRSMGGYIWQIKRPGITAATTVEGAHHSANDGSEFEPDAVINNEHTIKHLQQLVLGEFWALDAGLQRVTVEIA